MNLVLILKATEVTPVSEGTQRVRLSLLGSDASLVLTLPSDTMELGDQFQIVEADPLIPAAKVVADPKRPVPPPLGPSTVAPQPPKGK